MIWADVICVEFGEPRGAKLTTGCTVKTSSSDTCPGDRVAYSLLGNGTAGLTLHGYGDHQRT